eukprot:gb/GECH01003869.1/.p1 GENE.gb/GECH01003869.1/~~gb/GECH01003869.1/.p1  ORF type:complete len:274 (+),score=36.19 gb/GECH01003869.1/:1-822(+)
MSSTSVANDHHQHQHQRTNATDFMEYHHGSHPLIQQFLNLEFVQTHRHTPECRSIFNHNHIAKEVTEAMAMLQRIQRMVDQLHQRYYQRLTRDEFESRLTFLDLCCGKGFTASVVAAQFPAARVLMLDKDTRMKIGHIAVIPNITFQRAVVQLHARRGHPRNQDADTIVARDIEAHPSSIYIAIGMHLCSRLSERLIQMYNRHSEIRGLALSPCCVRNDAVRPMQRLGKGTTLSTYGYWTLFLYLAVTMTGTRNIEQDERMFSERNNFIIATK